MAKKDTPNIKPKSITPKSTKKKKVNGSKLGSMFEKKIIKKCDEYKLLRQAYIEKIPTDIAVIRRGGKVVECIFRDKASLDFSGVIKDGRCVYIEAKSCQSKTSFPFSLVKDHQFTIAFELLNYTNLVFFLIEMREIDKVFLIKASDIKEFKDTQDRQSLPLEWINKKGIEIDGKEFDFLASIDKI